MSRVQLVLVSLGLVAAASTAGCAGRGRPSPFPRGSAGGPPSSVRVIDGGWRIENVDLERYVRGTVEAETWLRADEAPDVAERVLHLQALVARTYALANLGRHQAEGADLCATTHCQLYRSPGRAYVHASPLDQAMAHSAGRVLLFGGAPIQALFHASCGGATSAPEAVWGGRALPYLRSVEDGFCARSAAPWHVRLERSALVRALDADPRTRVDGRLDAITIVSRDEGDRAVLVALTGRRSPVVRGEHLRAVITQAFGARAVRSTRFRVTREGEAFVFDGTGFGHGTGLCQAGALDRLRHGASVADVIAHYYPGVTVGWPRRIGTD